MKTKRTKLGWKIHIGKGKVKRTVKIPIVEAIIIGIGLVEGYLIGGFMGALLGVALSGLAILSVLFCAFPFIGLLIYHWIMTYAFGVAQVHMKVLYLVGFIYGLFTTWYAVKEILKALGKKAKESKKVITYEMKQN